MTYRSTTASDATASIGTLLIAFLVVLAIAIPASLWVAYAATVLWGWFVTPTFGIAVPGVWTMFGLFILARLPFSKANAESESGVDWDKVWRECVHVAVGPAIALLLGWIALQFM